MQTTKIKGFTVTVFNSYNGTQIFINDANGVQVYAHRVSGNAIERAKEVIAQM